MGYSDREQVIAEEAAFNRGRTAGRSIVYGIKIDGDWFMFSPDGDYLLNKRGGNFIVDHGEVTSLVERIRAEAKRLEVDLTVELVELAVTP